MYLDSDFFSKFFEKFLFKKEKRKFSELWYKNKYKEYKILSFYLFYKINYKFFTINPIENFLIQLNLFNNSLKTNIEVPYEIFRVSNKLPNIWCIVDRWNWLEKKKRLNWGDIEISFDNMKIFYRGLGKTDEDAAAIRSNNIVCKKMGIFYYEIKIINRGRDGFIGVGLCSKDVDLDRIPGWEINSIGYHGDDGNIFKDSGTGISYGPGYSNGDIVGVCWNLLKKSVFFTKNGCSMSTTFFKLCPYKNKHMIPVVGLRTPGEIIEVNFCSSNFEFDLNFYIRNEIDIILKKSILLGKCSKKVFSEIYSKQNNFSSTYISYLNWNVFSFFKNVFLGILIILSFIKYNSKKKIQVEFYTILLFEEKKTLINKKQFKFWLNFKFFRNKNKFNFYYLIKYIFKNHFFYEIFYFDIKIKNFRINFSMLLYLSYRFGKIQKNSKIFDLYFIFYLYQQLNFKKINFQNRLHIFFSTTIKDKYWKNILSNIILRKIIKFFKNQIINNNQNFYLNGIFSHFFKSLFYLRCNIHIYSLINLQDFQYYFSVLKILMWF